MSLMTTTLNYGVIAEDGTVDVRLIYDHRVLDGATIARALGELETVLNHQNPPHPDARRQDSGAGACPMTATLIAQWRSGSGA